MTTAKPTVQRTWHCLTCPDHPQLTQDEMRAHLPVHELTGRTPATVHLQTHLDGETEAISINIWTFPNGVRFQESICTRRIGADLRRWRGAPRRGRA
jgi:hypothetical protein